MMRSLGSFLQKAAGGRSSHLFLFFEKRPAGCRSLHLFQKRESFAEAELAPGWVRLMSMKAPTQPPLPADTPPPAAATEQPASSKPKYDLTANSSTPSICFGDRAKPRTSNPRAANRCGRSCPTFTARSSGMAPGFSRWTTCCTHFRRAGGTLPT